jgi:cysteine synthase A
MAIYNNVEELIGKTPLMRLRRIEEKYSLSAKLYAKLEFLNPFGSVKDRAAKNMLDDAEAKGVLVPGAVVIEPTSGNTGIGLAAVGAQRGYRVIIIMPDSMSRERIAVMRAYGAEVVLTPGALGMKGAIARAEELKVEMEALGESCFIPSQFDNEANRDTHFLYTGPEIYSDLGADIAAFVAGTGTGGTVSGVGRYLKSKDEKIKVVAVEPYSSAVLSGGNSGAHKLQGIGAGFVPKIYDASVVDEVMTVENEEAYEMTRRLALLEGLLVGISSGAAVSAAVKLCEREEYGGKSVVTLLPDTGLRYLSEEGLF